MSCESDEARQRWADELWEVLRDSPTWEIFAEKLLAYAISLNQEVNGTRRFDGVNGHARVLQAPVLPQFGKNDFPVPRVYTEDGHDHEAT